jgi:hypothetical protein
MPATKPHRFSEKEGPKVGILKKIFKIGFVFVYSVFLAYLCLVFAGLYGMGPVPEKTINVMGGLIWTNIVLGLVAVILAFFAKPKLSFLIFTGQCLSFAGVLFAGTVLMPAEKEADLRASYKKINTRNIENAAIILNCEGGYRVSYKPPEKTSTGKLVASLYLVPPDPEDTPHHILSWVDGNAGNVFLKHKYKHLEPILPSCKNDEMSFDELVAMVRALEP